MRASSPAHRGALVVSLVVSFAVAGGCGKKGDKSAEQIEQIEQTDQNPSPGSYSVDVSGFTRECEYDSDCVVVTANQCEMRCSCPDTAIAESEEERFEAAAKAIDCSGYQQSEDDCGGCATTRGACEDGACVLEQAPGIYELRVEASDLDRSCAEDRDCRAVVTLPCLPCPCPGTAIAKTALEEFRERADALDCPTHEPVDCEDCVRDTPVCIDGACRLPRE